MKSEKQLSPEEIAKGVEAIEKQVASNFAIRLMMNSTIDKLKRTEKEFEKNLGAGKGKELIKGLISGDRKMTKEEYSTAVKKFGLTAVNQIDALENLNPAQKAYIFKRLGY